WSTRRHAIEARQRGLAAAFVAEHGRVPTTVESLALAQQANLETRPAKHEPRSEAEQRQAWRQQATAVLSGDTTRARTHPDEMVASALGAWWGRVRERGGDAGGDRHPQVAAGRVLEVLEASRATWQVWHVRAETLRQARAAEVALGELEEYVREVEHRVLSALSLPVGVPPELGEPDVLRRPDGQSAHVVHGSQAYTSRAVLAAEEELLTLGLRRDGRQVGPQLVEAVVVNESAGGLALDRSQAAMVRSLATSGCRVQVALAPAGTGKTSALRVLARAWEASGGTVLGLAPTAVAAEELGRATDVPSDTIAKYLHEATRSAADAPDHGHEVRNVGPGTLVLIDEAGMAGTRELAAAVRQVVDAGGSVRLVGDDQQLSAVAAGGLFRDLAEQGHTHGTTATLTELHRFTDPAEGTATLAVRDGDPAALDHYFDNGRVHTGDLGTASEAAYAAWAADQEPGLSSLLLAATRDTVRELNQRARQDRLETTGAAVGPEVGLADGTRASAGDLVVTRRNDRRLRAGDGSWVKNGDRWRVLDVHPEGSVSVGRHAGAAGTSLARRLTLPAGYVAEHVQLGYASTIHGAQGATVDTTHTVLTGNETRQTLYVALSRGRTSNHLYVGAPAPTLDGVGPDIEETPADPREVLTDILARDGRAQSATTVERGDAAQQLREAVLAYQDALPVLAQQVLGPERMAALDDALDRWLPGLTQQPAYPHLRGQLALRWVDGDAPKTVLDQATWFRGKHSLTDSDDPAAVLAWRISTTTPPSYRDAPLPWLPDVPTVHRELPDARDYLDRLTRRVEDLTERVASEARQEGASDRTPWQRALPPHIDGRLVGDLAVWRAAHGIPATDPRPTGPPAREPSTATHQARLVRRLTWPEP
ncbi:MAG: AAA family ATPase, partial [Actinobacteria bacterium]|nr:AAA family ATPase [Actinomycetota bacterium]